MNICKVVNEALLHFQWCCSGTFIANFEHISNTVVCTTDLEQATVSWEDIHTGSVLKGNYFIQHLMCMMHKN